MEFKKSLINIFDEDWKPYELSEHLKPRFDKDKMVIEQEFNILDMILEEISSKQNNLFRRFCRDVCEKTAYKINSQTKLDEFAKAFDDAFDEVEKEWKNEAKE